LYDFIQVSDLLFMPDGLFALVPSGFSSVPTRFDADSALFCPIRAASPIRFYSSGRSAGHYPGYHINDLGAVLASNFCLLAAYI